MNADAVGLFQSESCPKGECFRDLLPLQVSFTGLRKLTVSLLERVWNVNNVSVRKDPGEFLLRAEILILRMQAIP